MQTAFLTLPDYSCLFCLSLSKNTIHSIDIHFLAHEGLKLHVVSFDDNLAYTAADCKFLVLSVNQHQFIVFCCFCKPVFASLLDNELLKFAQCSFLDISVVYFPLLPADTDPIDSRNGQFSERKHPDIQEAEHRDCNYEQIGRHNMTNRRLYQRLILES